MKFITIATLSAMILAGSASAIEINVPGDYATIQSAIDSINLGNSFTRITIDAGTYYENGNLELDSLNGTGNEIEIVGAVDKEGAPAVFVHAVKADESVFQLMYLQNVSVLVENLVLTGGTSNDGAGMWIRSCDDLVVRNCTITGNNAGRWGGGAYVYDMSANNPIGVQFVDCVFSGNTANEGGGLYVDNVFAQRLVITDCEISGNSASNHGGGLEISEGIIAIEGTSVIGNDSPGHGGGLRVINSSNDLVSLTDSVVSGNTASCGGGIACYSGIVTGGVVRGNTAIYGGGFWFEDSQPTLNGMLVQENHAIGNGGGIYTPGDDAYPDVIAATVCGNTPNQVWHIEGDATNIINESCSSNPAACCVNGACIMVEPLMCDDVGGTLSNGGEEDCSSTECAEPCLGDVNNDSEINVNDLLTVIANWGGCP